MPLTSDLRQSDPVAGSVDDADITFDARGLIDAPPAVREALVGSVAKACEQTGFFYLANAFENSSLVPDLLSRMREFFSLADDDPIKRAVDNRHKSGSYGWMPLFGEPAYQPGTIAHLESFDCGPEQTATKLLEGQNVWPSIDGFRADVSAYWEAVSELGNVALAAISEAAGLAPDFLPTACSTQELNTLRLLHYPANETPASDIEVGISAHTDFECVTLILQTQPGLELTDVKGNWYDAPSRNDRIVVLLGDMLERWTNGRFRATGHRVRNTRWERYSAVMFFAVDSDRLIEPLAPFVDERNPPAYSAVTQREHIDNEIRRAELNRASPR